jgi:hypothetical protein
VAVDAQKHPKLNCYRLFWSLVAGYMHASSVIPYSEIQSMDINILKQHISEMIERELGLKQSERNLKFKILN